jgi:hypothetical protein
LSARALQLQNDRPALIEADKMEAIQALPRHTEMTNGIPLSAEQRSFRAVADHHHLMANKIGRQRRQ